MIILFNPYKAKKRDLDKFVIYDSFSNDVVQFDISEEIAQRNVRVLNDHEVKNGLKRSYTYASLERTSIDGL